MELFIPDDSFSKSCTLDLVSTLGFFVGQRTELFVFAFLGKPMHAVCFMLKKKQVSEKEAHLTQEECQQSIENKSR